MIDPSGMSIAELAPMASETNLLIVDDSEIDRTLLVEHLGSEGYRIHMAVNGREAWQMLQAKPTLYDVVVLDWMMPEMNGLELLSRIKKNPELKMLPVIFQTAAADYQNVLEGIRTGAYYYLTKPYDGEMLRSIVRAAATDSHEFKTTRDALQRGLTSFALMREAVFTCRTLTQAYDLAATLARLCPEPDSAVLGLTELIVNGVEHGNLGINYEEKTRLNSSGEWLSEVERRLDLPENRDKVVEVRFERSPGSLRFTIRDHGKGFDWRRFLTIDPQRAFHTHGRGIAMANLLSFSSLEYHGEGNEVVATVNLPA